VEKKSKELGGRREGSLSPAHEDALLHAADTAGIPVTRIGHFHDGPGQVIVRQGGGEPLVLKRGGWSHF